MTWLPLDEFAWSNSSYELLFADLTGSYLALTANEEFEPMTEYARDFVGFCRNILGVEPWTKQEEIGNSVMEHPRTAVAACYSSGKTFIAACISLWWIYTRRPAMLITTAPTGRQVRDLLWREIRKLIRKAKKRLPGRALQVRLVLADDWQGQGFSSDKPNSTAGYHEAKNVLFIEDEAAGMDPEVVAGYDGLTASEGSRHLKIGNPICSSGPFWDCFNNPSESKRWNLIEISALETPNVIHRRAEVPGLVTHEWVEEKRAKWGEDSPLWKTKVLGKFFTGSGLKVIPADWIPKAIARWEEGLQDPTWWEGPKVLGVDVAGGGRDQTVSYLRTGRMAQLVDAIQTDDLMAIGYWVCDLAEEHKVERVVIDKTGLGQGVYCKVVELQEQDGRIPGVEIVGVHLSETPLDSETYQHRSDEIQFAMRRALDPNNPHAVAIRPDDKVLHEELPLRGWELADKSGKICTEGKKKLKSRGISSPDNADAFAMCFAPTMSVWWN